MMSQTNVIHMKEHDHEQCAHIFQKIDQNHLQNHLGQNNFIKVHIPYLKIRYMKDMTNVLK
jgi:hypothetical protein